MSALKLFSASLCLITLPASAMEPIIPLEPLVESQTRFTLSLFHSLRTEETGNLFFSPFSIHTALAMTLAGADGNTAREMEAALALPQEDPVTHHRFDLLYDKLISASRLSQQTLRIANALVRVGGPLDADYLQRLTESYHAEIFPGNLPEINQWVARQTEGKIPEILTGLDPDTVAVILNAVYFKADWAEAFDPDLTRPRPFSRTEADAVDVPTMFRKGQFALLENEHLRALRLPYQHERFDMVLMLPGKRFGLSELEEKLDAPFLSQQLGALDNTPLREVSLYLPRMKMETEYNLIPALQQLGMREAFDAQKADFRGMGWPPGALWIGQVVHKAFLEVNEEGTEAAAATAVAMVTRAMPAPPPVFHADQPFLFFIRESETGTVLFMGRLADPVISEP